MEVALAKPVILLTRMPSKAHEGVRSMLENLKNEFEIITGPEDQFIQRYFYELLI